MAPATRSASAALATNGTAVANGNSAKGAATPSSSSGPSTALQLLPLGVSLVGVPLMLFLSRVGHLDGSKLFLVATVLCLLVVVLPAVALKSAGMKLPWTFYLFMFFAFGCVVDSILSATTFGLTDVGLFYLEDGEKHLRGNHGGVINGWDATGHYFSYLFMTNAMLKGKDNTPFFRAVALFWAASVLNSLFVLLPAVACGRYGVDVEPSILLNVPFVLLPIWFAIKNLSPDNEKAGKSKAGNGGGSTTPTDILLGIISILASIFILFRTLIVLGARAPIFTNYAKHNEVYLNDPSKFPFMQQLVYAYWLVPVLLWAATVLLSGSQPSSRLTDLLLLSAGGTVQGQLAYFGGWLYECGPACGDMTGWVKPSWHGNGFWMSVGLNVVLMVLPCVLAWRFVGDKIKME